MAEDRLRHDRTQHNHPEDKQAAPARFPRDHRHLPRTTISRAGAPSRARDPPWPQLSPSHPFTRLAAPRVTALKDRRRRRLLPGRVPTRMTLAMPRPTLSTATRHPSSIDLSAAVADESSRPALAGLPPDQRGGYYDDRRPPPGQYPDPHQAQQYAAEGYYYRGPPGVVPPNGYPRPPQGPYQEYAPQPGGAPGMAQAAPRQRTSIACRYCRKRKIRCSGYQNTPGGKCQNCARMNQECIFQPVSSSSSTAFIPCLAECPRNPTVRRVRPAVGSQLRARRAPLPASPSRGPPPGPAPPNYYSQHPAPPPHPSQPTQSPTESFSSYGDDAQVAGRRRRRTPRNAKKATGCLPPRSGAADEEARRRSPAEFSNNSSPGNLAHLPYQGARQSPRNAAALPQPPGQGGRSPGAANGSSGASTPARQQQASSGQSQNSTSVMSLSNLVDKSDIDRGMIDRLNRPRDSKGANGSR
ncbi:hypothetical protein ACCO45_009458 [Purpureocillium lilacinum]|uniref:Uncharacterized protein n=1 Tax=Purpureocillium lilacinum TaxID=33203 RepID=A0ACC4DL93_PURLI